MPIFEFQATDAAGKKVSGTVTGTSLDSAARDLSGRGLLVSDVRLANRLGDPLAEPVAEKRPQVTPPVSDPLMMQRNRWQTLLFGPLLGRVALSDLSFFFRQFAAMLDAGVNPMQSLNTLSTQTRSRKLQGILRELSEQAHAGRPVSFGMQRYPEVFSPLIMGLVRAGEKGGFLPNSCSQIAEYLEAEIRLRNMIRRETFWPKLTLFGGTVVIAAASAVINAVRPNSEIQISSPLSSAGTWLWLGPLIVGLFLFVRLVLPIPTVKYYWDALLIHLPYLGTTLKQFAMAKFGRALGALYKGGAPIHESFRLAADACGNEFLRSQMASGFKGLETGGGITETLAKTGAFSPIVLDMLATGEQTGSLDKTLTKAAEYYEGEAEVRAVSMGKVFGLLVFFAVAIYVFLVVANFYMGYAKSLIRLADPSQ